MIKKNILTEEQISYVIENREFDNDIIFTKEKVVVILTQDWCPQWTYMSSWIYSLKTEEDIDIYEFIYNKAECFYKFMHFKENEWGNYQIPYLRYYLNGKLFKETNFVNEQEFINIIMLKTL